MTKNLKLWTGIALKKMMHDFKDTGCELCFDEVEDEDTCENSDQEMRGIQEKQFLVSQSSLLQMCTHCRDPANESPLHFL